MGGIFCGTALLFCANSQLFRDPVDYQTKEPHIVCQSGYVLDVNEYKGLFITPSAHITDRLNHSLAVKMTVAQ